MKKRQLTQDVLNRVNRIKHIIDESSEIVRSTKNKDTEQSRIDVILTKIIELKGIRDVYQGIDTENLELIEWQCVKAKYDHLKGQFGEES